MLTMPCTGSAGKGARLPVMAVLGTRYDARFQKLYGIRVMIQEMLYHYTNCCGLKGILESRQLWLTNISCFEDTKEYIHTVSQLSQKLSLPAMMSEGFLSFLTQKNPRTFVSCFCRDDDRIDLWKRYGGYNIEFAEQDMRAMAEYQSGGTITYCRGPSPCIYDENKQNTFIENTIEQWKSKGNSISAEEVYHLATVFKRQ